MTPPTEVCLETPDTSKHAGKVLAACVVLLTSSVVATAAGSAGQCMAIPPPADNPFSLPAELAGLNPQPLFETDFNGEPDFISADEEDICYLPGSAICEVKPEAWDYYYSTEKWHPSMPEYANSKPSIEISDRVKRGGSGKSFIVWDESQGETWLWGSNSVLAKDLEQDYNDIYVEFWIRFQPNYRWMALETDHGQNMSKLLRVAHYTGEPGGAIFRHGGQGTSGPLVFLDSMIWKPENQTVEDRALFLVSKRCAPHETAYFCGDFAPTANALIPGNPRYQESIGDSNWHKVGLRLTMNSQPGVPDGSSYVWLDGELIFSENNVPYLTSSASPGLGWNMVMLGGNTHNYPEEESVRLEQWYAIDDVRVFSLN